MLADVTVLSGSTASLILTSFVIAGLAFFTIRSRAISYWKDEADGAERRLKTAQATATEQRELKHEALNRVAALEKLTDLSPVLEQLAKVQQALVDVMTHDAHAATLARLDEILARMDRQNDLLERVVRNGEGASK